MTLAIINHTTSCPPYHLPPIIYHLSPITQHQSPIPRSHLDVAHACPWHLTHCQLPHDQCKRVDVGRRRDECTTLPSQPEELGCFVAGGATLRDRGECRDRAYGLQAKSQWSEVQELVLQEPVVQR